MHKPQEDHMNDVICIIRNLKWTVGRGVQFKKDNDLEIKAYIDADWAGKPINKRSTSGYFTLVGGNLVSWRSKR